MNGTMIGSAVGVLGALAFYLTLARRTYVHNPDNKLVKFGCLALAFFALAGASNSIPNFPLWLGMCLLTLSLLFAVTTLFLVIQRAWRFLRGRVGRGKKNVQPDAFDATDTPIRS